MNFNFLFPNKIIFGPGESSNIGKYIKDFTAKPLLIINNSFKKTSNYTKIIHSLTSYDLDFIEISKFMGEPTVEVVDEAVLFARTNNVDSIISIGGGSTIDIGKAVAGLVNNDGSVIDYLEGIGAGRIIKNKTLPFVALPTTSGSGAETTKNAVITSQKYKCKRSFRDEKLIARLIILDPELPMTQPQDKYLLSSMDAICQLIESFVSKKTNLFVKSFSNSIIPKALNAIIKIHSKNFDIENYSLMSLASFISGITLANSGLGAVHGFASGIGGMYNIPHGLICAVLLPGICRLNADKVPGIYNELALLCNKENENNFIEALFDLNNRLNIPKDFKEYNISENDIMDIIALSKGSSMTGNPADLNDVDLERFIRKYI